MTIPLDPLPLSYHQELTRLAVGSWPHAPSRELVDRRLVNRFGKLTQAGRIAAANLELLAREAQGSET